MAEIEAEGRTVEDAIRAGLEKLGLTRDKVKIKILNEGTTGLFGLMGTKPARVLLTSTGETGGAGTVDLAASQKAAKEVVEKILTLMNIPHTDVTATVKDDHVAVAMKTSEGNLLIGKGGQTLEALEHVVNLILNKDEHTRTKVELDTEDYRRRQEERLVSMAAKAAEQVAQSGRPYRFDPMSAKERRILHLALKEHADVETFSEGEGPFRKVVVKPKTGK